MFAASNFTFAQTFEKLNIPDLKGGYLGFSSFVDYNNDGFLDVFITGVDFGNRFNNAVFYENNGNLSFSESPITNIPRIIYGDYSWADFDNNGTLDLLYNGTTSGSPDKGISKIYRNVDNGCEFIEVPVALPGITAGTSDWVDIDNDGLLDVFLVGINVNNENEVVMFRNLGGDNFIAQNSASIDPLPGDPTNLTQNSARWADLDGDGLKDLLIARSTELDFSLELYKNLGGFQFSKQNIGLPKLSYVAMEIGDINNDNHLDLVFTGSPNLKNLSGDGRGDFYVFTNNGNMNFTNTFTIQNEGVMYNDIELGDFNNDGVLDAANYGTGPWGTFPEITKIYTNNQNGSFSTFAHTLPDCRFGGMEFGDFDNDNDLDILYFGRIEDPADNEITYIYENKLIDIELPTEILFKETCLCDNTLSFTLNNDVDTIQWNFGDPTTGALNTSKDIKASHVFSNEANYTISATYTKGSVTNTLTQLVTIKGIPIIIQPSDFADCNNTNNTYDLNTLKNAEILGGTSPNDFEVFYYDSFNNAQNDRNRFSIPYTVQNANETIYVRVQSTTNAKCFVLTDFQFTLENPPTANTVQDLFVCDDNNDGRAEFDLTTIAPQVIGNQTNVTLTYYDSQNSVIPATSLNAYQNGPVDSETIRIRITDTQTDCYAETTVGLLVSSLPIANTLEPLIGCDDNGDGISEYFDTSMVAPNILGSQSGMEVSYYDGSGNQLPGLPSPYTNTTTFQETIIVRVTDINTMCFDETELILQTSDQPQINILTDFYACGDDKGFALFDTSTLEAQLIGNQTGLTVTFYDANDNLLHDFTSGTFINQTPFRQQIKVKVENDLNTTCFSESSFYLKATKLPKIELQETYYLCDLTPSLDLEINPEFDSYLWTFEDGSQIAATPNATISSAGNYSLYVTNNIDGITCERSVSFSLVRSELPHIEEVNFEDLSKQNYIEIIAAGDGDFEYSINGVDYFDNNVFRDLIGGTYSVYVRDKRGCGEDSAEVTLIDYPRFFTPNGDNSNDYWQIFGGSNFPNSMITIYDRYGKPLSQFSTLDRGWSGMYNEILMPSSDYWFKADLGNGRTFYGHFALKR